MTHTARPDMSVILITPDCFETIRKTVQHLRAQTVKDRLELVIVAPSAEALGGVEALREEFFAVKVVEVGTLTSTGTALAEGVRRAGADVVVYAEDHSYPDPDWAEALIEAHRQPWAVVGPAVLSANPGSVVSRAEYLVGFGAWGEGLSSGETESLPTHQAAYKRSVLLRHDAELSDLLEHEAVLHTVLRAGGERLYHEAAAKTRHVNISLLGSYLMSAWHGTRIFGAHRARFGRWSPGRRLLHSLAAPLIPPLRLARLITRMRRMGQSHLLEPLVLLLLGVGLVISVLGEVAGYLFDVGGATRHRCALEHKRERNVREQDRQLCTAG